MTESGRLLPPRAKIEVNQILHLTMRDEQSEGHGGNTNGPQVKHTDRCEWIVRISLNSWARGTDKMLLWEKGQRD